MMPRCSAQSFFSRTAIKAYESFGQFVDLASTSHRVEQLRGVEHFAVTEGIHWAASRQRQRVDGVQFAAFTIATAGMS